MELNKSSEKIVAGFKKRRGRQIVAVAPAILAFLGLISVEGNPDGLFGLTPSMVLAVSFALIISVFIFSFLNWRCPSCSKYLGKAFNPKFCSKCGTQLS